MTYTEEWAAAVEERLRDRLINLDYNSFRVRLLSFEREGSRLRIVVRHQSMVQPIGSTRDIEGWYETTSHDPAIAADAEFWDAIEPVGTARVTELDGVLWTGDTETDPMFREVM